MRAGLFAWLLFFAPCSAALACAGTELPWLELEVIASEPSLGEPARRVAVYPGGCVEVRFARSDIRHGRYAFWLMAAEIDALRTSLTRDRLRDFDRAAVQAAVQANEQALRRAPQPGRARLSTVSCGDTHRIVVRESGTVTELTWYALAHDAERHAEIAALVALRRFADQLDRLSEDQRMVPQAQDRS